MASPTDASSTSGDSSGTGLDAPRGANPRRQPSRLNQALAWVGIVAGGLFIVAAVFFAGFFLSWSSAGRGEHHTPSAPMACCADMKAGDKMPMGGRMTPGGMMGPASQSPPTPPRS
jgi:hypothetical protein